MKFILRNVSTIALAIIINANTVVPALASQLGTTVGNYFYTDIVTYLWGTPINSINIGGITLIDAESLRYYGFHVSWSPEERLLTIEDQFTSHIAPEALNGSILDMKEGTSGEVAGQYYYTDIKTYLNGVEITSYNIGGRTFLVAEDMSDHGYTVTWDNSDRTLDISRTLRIEVGYENSAFALTEDYLQNSEEWIDFDIVLATINNMDDEDYRNFLSERIKFLEDQQVVHVYFDARHDWDIQTYVIGDKIYVEREGINNFYNLYNIPFILTPNERAIVEARQEEYANNPDAFISVESLQLILAEGKPSDTWINGRRDVLVAVWSGGVTTTDVKSIEFRDNISREVLGTVEIFLIDNVGYVRKTDINFYLIEHGYETVE